MSLMGVDIGTSGCKAVAFDASGEVLAEGVEGYAPRFSAPARVEMEMEALWGAVAAAVRSAASGVGDDPVEAVGLSSHGESFVPLDAGGAPLGPAIMNADNRATAEARWFEETLGRKRIFETTGLIVHPMYPMPKLKWLQRHEPEMFASAARFASVTDYVLLKLGLEPYLAHPLACRFMAFDVRRLEWSEEMLEVAGVSGDRLPTPVPAGTAAGRLSRSAAAELGIEAGALVVASGHDQPCGALGTGAIAPGMVADSMGTYECLTAVVDAPTLGEKALEAAVNSYCHVVPDRYITIVYYPAGLMVRWFCDTFCGEDAAAAAAAGRDLYEHLDELTPEGPTGLCILPYLIGSGNPHFDAQATGVVHGLTPATTRHAVYKGILEGLAAELDLLAELLAGVVGEFDAIRCSGGGARSSLGLRLRAALTGKRLETVRSEEAVCLGAALQAGVAAGTYSSLAEAVGQVVQVSRTVSPDPELAESYAPQVARYRRLFPAVARVHGG
jgi:xylulokinase